MREKDEREKDEREKDESKIDARVGESGTFSAKK